MSIQEKSFSLFGFTGAQEGKGKRREKKEKQREEK